MLTKLNENNTILLSKFEFLKPLIVQSDTHNALHKVLSNQPSNLRANTAEKDTKVKGGKFNIAWNKAFASERKSGTQR